MVLIFAETHRGEFKKTTFEALTYGKKLADQLGVPCAALVLGTEVNDSAALGRYGASRILHVANEALNQRESQVDAAVIAEAAKQLGATVVILNFTSTGRAIAGRIAIRLNAGLVSGVNSLPNTEGGRFMVRKPVFSGKAFADYEITSPVKVLMLTNNVLRPEETSAPGTVESLNIPVPTSRIRIKEVKTAEGRVPLPEAEVVVSAGRGLKDPGNWGIIEELAEALHATTACSRPVSDSGWRPHHEHVGQTGIAIRPNLYIAVGISGAIQHLAGVNNSKVIVVINKDADAPFFKAADYGVVGDLFEIVPKLTEAVKEFRRG